MSDSETPRRSFPTKCVDCESKMESPLFCGSCRRLYPADGLNYFELFGLEPVFDVDEARVREKYLQLARGIHPDRLAGDSSNNQQIGMRSSARVNEAYRVLLNPALRAEYLLEISGGKAATDDKHVPREVLTQTLMLREEIEEAREAGDDEMLDNLREQIRREADATISEIAELARALPGSDETRTAMRTKLNTLRYYRRLQEQF